MRGKLENVEVLRTRNSGSPGKAALPAWRHLDPDNHAVIERAVRIAAIRSMGRPGAITGRSEEGPRIFARISATELGPRPAAQFETEALASQSKQSGCTA